MESTMKDSTMESTIKCTPPWNTTIPLGNASSHYLSKFVKLAEMLYDFPRPSHDGLCKAIDTYLKSTRASRKTIERAYANWWIVVHSPQTHPVQKERLPLRVAVQVLMLEQARASTASACATPNLRTGSATNLHSRSLRSLATNSENQDDKELSALKIELAKLKLASGSRRYADTNILNKTSLSKFKSLFLSTKNMAKLQHSKTDHSTGSSSSESPFNKSSFK